MKKIFIVLLFLMAIPIVTAHASVDKVEEIEKPNLNVPTYTIPSDEDFPQASGWGEGKYQLTGGYNKEPYRGVFFLEKGSEKYLYNVDEEGYLKINSQVEDLDHHEVFFNNWGMSYEGIQEFEGKKYYFINGVIQKGWTKLTNVSYFKEDNKRDYWSYSDVTTGELQTGLVRIDGEDLLFATSDGIDTWNGNYYGSYYTGGLCQDQFVYVDGKTYYADSDGHPVKGLLKATRSIYNSERLFYFDEDGVMQQEKLIKIGDDYYYFEFWGGAVTNTIGYQFDGKYYGFDSEGKNYKGTWVGEYYFNEDGTGADGFVTIDGNHYHFGYYSFQYSRGLIKLPNPETHELEDYLFEKNGHAYAGIHTYSSNYPPTTSKYYTDEWGKVIRLSSGWHQMDDKFIYFNTDGTVKSLFGLQTILDSKYLLDENGVAQTGLRTISGKTYYFGTDGKMQFGWQTIDAKKYYFGSDGIMKTGWQNISGKMYFFDTNGVYLLKYGMQTISGSIYYFGTDGIMKTGWQTISTGKYYFDPNGKMKTGWQTISNKKYYFATSGKMYIGWQTISGTKYYFDSNGIFTLKYGWQTISGSEYYFGLDGKMRIGWQSISGKKYYFGTDGKMKTGWQTLSGKKYYFNSEGAYTLKYSWQTISGKKYYFGTDGKMKTGWQTISKKKHYFGTDGTMKTGWQTISGKKYYFDSHGVYMVKYSWQTISGKKYYFGTDGKMKTGWQTISGTKYYFDSTGVYKVKYSWQSISGYLYYFGTDGKMKTNWQTIDHKVHYFGSDGKMRTGKVKIGKVYYLFDKNGIYIKKL